MGLFVKRYDTGETVQVKKYIIDLHENEESIWSNEWYGRHVIGRHCEWCDGKETTDEQSNCIKPVVSNSFCECKNLNYGYTVPVCYNCRKVVDILAK